jgi:hypothetical protein
MGDTLEVVCSCRAALDSAAADKSSSKRNERDFQRAMEQATGEGSAPVKLDHWPSVGRIDVLLPGRTVLELNGATPWLNCAWDVAKLGAAS